MSNKGDKGHSGYQKLDNDVALLAEEMAAAARVVSSFADVAKEARNALRSTEEMASGAAEALEAMRRGGGGGQKGGGEEGKGKSSPKSESIDLSPVISLAARMGPEVAAAVQTGVAPLQRAADMMVAMTDQVGGSVVTMARHVDVYLKHMFETIRNWDKVFNRFIVSALPNQDQLKSGERVNPFAKFLGGVKKARDVASDLYHEPYPLRAVGRAANSFVGAPSRLSLPTQPPGFDQAAAAARAAMPPAAAAKAPDWLEKATQERLLEGASPYAIRPNRHEENIMGGFKGDVARKSLTKLIQDGELANKTLRRLARAPLTALAAPARAAAAAVGSVATAGKRAANSLWGLARQGLAAFGFVGSAYAVFSFFKTGIMEASNLNETLSKTDAVMGEASGATKAFANDLAAKFGLVKRTTLDAAVGFAGLGKGLGGLSGKSLSDFTNQFTMMSADLASFANMDMGEAAKALTIGLAGNQSDTLRQLGVILTDDTVKAYALAHGIAKGNGALTEQQKLQARAGLIMEKLHDAQGDLARTADSPANAMRKLQGSITNIGASIGTSLLPIVSEVLSLLNRFTTRIAAAIDGNKGFLDSLGSAGASAIDTLATGFTHVYNLVMQVPHALASVFGGDSLGMVTGFGQVIKDHVAGAFDFMGRVIRNLPDYLEILGLKFTETFQNVIAWIGTIPQNLAIIGDYVANNWQELITDALNYVGTVFQNLGSNIAMVAQAIWDFLSGKQVKIDWKPLMEGFQATAAELPQLIQPALTDVSGQVADVYKRIDQNEAARNAERAKQAAKPNAAKVMPGADAEGASKPEKEKYHTAGAVEMGSSEAYSSSVKNQLRQGKVGEKGIDKVAKNSDEQVAIGRASQQHLKRIADGMKPATSPPPVVPIGA